MPMNNQLTTRQNSPPTNDPLRTKLVELINEKDCVAFIGAGVSAPDYPCWKDLIVRMAEQFTDLDLDINTIPAPKIAQRMYETDKDLFYKTLKDIFGRKKSPTSAIRYHYLARIPFKAYVTTNYDPLLIDIFSLHKNVTFSEHPKYINLNAANLSNGEIFHIHGRIDPDDPNIKSDLIFTRSSYEKAYSKSVCPLNSFLGQLFFNHDVCFLGCSAQDEELMDILKTCKSFIDNNYGLNEPDPPLWIAVVDEQISISDKDKFSDCGIQLLKYSKTDDDWGTFDDVLKFLARVKRPKCRTYNNRKHSIYDEDQEIHP